MLFNSLDFAVFLPVVFIAYWVAHKNIKVQNFLLLISSYVFYAWWDWRFLGLIIFSSIVDYVIGNKLVQVEKQRSRRILLSISLLVNLGLLAFFKYFNFFVESFIDGFNFFGANFNYKSLKIILPVGISFYTFQTLSYSIDIYRRKISPTKDIVSFFAFVAFFPQLVAGPIERASHLLPQFHKRRVFDLKLAESGIYQMIWGLFKKVVIADHCAGYVNEIFANYSHYEGSTLLWGAVLFAFQIYCDFSGYSDIAIGVSRLFGFDLMKNFAFPYFSRDIGEFWRRWHISLSTWFRDYLYIPLGGSRGSKIQILRNTLIIFVVSGFWHGANWTFICWGALNALYFIPLLLLQRNRTHTDTVALRTVFPSLKEFFQMGITFFITVLAWVFFRAENVEIAFQYIIQIFSPDLISIPSKGVALLPFIIILLLFEWANRRKEFGLDIIELVRWKKVILSALVVDVIILFAANSNAEFIYFQF